MISIGIDFSLSSPAIAALTSPSEYKLFFLCKIKKAASYTGPLPLYGALHLSYASFEQRIDQITDWAVDIVTAYPKDSINITLEDYAYGAGGKVFHIAENTGLLKHKLYKAGYPFQVASPAIIKKAATGKGNATKMMMHDAFTKQTGIDLHQTLGTSTDTPCSDIVDAYYAAALGLAGVAHTIPMRQISP